MEPRASFRPRLLDSLREYNRQRFFADLNAGLVVGVVALSLCIGLGIASGVTPAAGLYAGIIGGFLVSALGGSRVQIGGPAGAFVGLVALIVAQHGLGNLLICTMMAGALMFMMGALRLGTLIRFVPHPVTIGFTCGIAITILTTQIRPFLGLDMAHEPAEFLPKMAALWHALPTLDLTTTILAGGSLAILLFWPAKWNRRIPASIVAVAVATVLVSILDLDTTTIGTRFPGGIPQGLPRFAWPSFDLERIGALVRPAFTIAVLGSIESLLSAVVADGMIDDHHDSNQELMAQGAANMVVPFFGGLPVTGVIARTATNIRTGAETPVAGLVHAGVLLVVLLVAAPLAGNIPLATLAAVLLVVAVRMGEWSEFLLLRKRMRGDAAVFLATFSLTVLFDLTIAVEVGMVLAAGLFIKRISETTQVHALSGEDAEAPLHERVADVPREVLVYRVFGALMFGTAEKLENVLRRMGSQTRVIVVHLAAVTAIDATALNRLENLHRKLHRGGRHLVISAPHTQPLSVMENAGFFDDLGRENVTADLESAIARALLLLAESHDR